MIKLYQSKPDSELGGDQIYYFIWKGILQKLNKIITNKQRIRVYFFLLAKKKENPNNLEKNTLRGS